MVILDFKFNLNNPKKSILKTNAKSEGVEEILEIWLRNQIGKGKDEKKPEERKIYHINIQVDLTEDTLYTKSDTGNDSLTCGIVQTLFGMFLRNELKMRNI